MSLNRSARARAALPYSFPRSTVAKAAASRTVAAAETAAEVKAAQILAAIRAEFLAALAPACSQSCCYLLRAHADPRPGAGRCPPPDDRACRRRAAVPGVASVDAACPAGPSADGHRAMGEALD